MYTLQLLHPATIYGFFQNDDVRLTLKQLAVCLKHPVEEIAQFNIQTGPDGKIGRPEVAFLRHMHLGKRL